ncbi:hypothetical protein F5X99DRAFT_431519 [Biscogniauxia marginata]|nr:hypothetical protein F5X99DRAFT_431519 [Biscogniauxia marginata]
MSTLEQKSADARSRGNELYRKGLFDQAIKAYFEALKLTPNDHTPLANLAAVQFELGNYSGSTIYAEKAIRLLNDEGDDSPKKQKLLLHSASWNSSHTTNPSSLAKLLDELSRYKPVLIDEPEFYPIGHDDAMPEYDSQMAKLPHGQLAWLFAGIGDARHFYKTLSEIVSQELMELTKKSRLHFTLLDLKPAAIARNLLVFELLSEYSAVALDETMACIIYVYASQIMPPFAYREMQKALSSVIRKLEEGKPLLDWLYVPESQQGSICHHLRSWQKDLYGKYDTASFKEWASEQARKQVINQFRAQGKMPNTVLPGAEKEGELFATFGFMAPNDQLLRKHESTLENLIGKFQGGKPNSRERLSDYLDKNWKPNVTLIDIDWESEREMEAIFPPWIGTDPCRLAKSLYPPVEPVKSSSLMHHIETFFQCVVYSMKELRTRLTVEVLVGEMTDTFERIKYNTLKQRCEGSQGRLNPEKFPKSYDRIHMSNIPDYIGGPLSIFLYGLPLLHESKISTLSSCVRLNTYAFEDHEQFLREYTLMSDTEAIQNHFGVVLREDSPSRTDYPGHDLALNGYTMWSATAAKRLPLAKLMSRNALQRFLDAHLLKICVPFPRPKQNVELVYAPLNLTMLFRLVVRMHEVGYPAHWLSGIINRMLEGELTTSARAPRQMVQDAQSVDLVHPTKTMSIRPWAAELSTLGSIWQPLLPFGLLFRKGLLPPLDTIKKYGITFPPYWDDWLSRPHFMLVFWDSKLGSPPEILRKTLIDDELGDHRDKSKTIRESGIHVLTTFRWVTKTRTAWFWLRSDVMEVLRREDWKAYIWRSDTYEKTTDAVSVRENIEEIGSWID